MSFLTPPPINCPPEITKAFSSHLGESCVVGLKTKYYSEKEWLSHRLWMAPGWDVAEVWRRAHQWLYYDAVALYYDGSEIQEVKFDSFKLV